MNRSELKESVKQRLRGNWAYAILMWLPALLIIRFSASGTGPSPINITVEGTFTLNNWIYGYSLLSLLYAVVALWISWGVGFSFLTFCRRGRGEQNPLTAFSRELQPKGTMLGIFMISLQQFIRLSLWSYVFLIPAIVKTFSYSQAYYIYRDKLVQGEKISFAGRQP